MSDEKFEPMDPQMAALLVLKRKVPEPSDAIRARVFGRVVEQVGVMPGGGGGSGAPARGGPSAGPNGSRASTVRRVAARWISSHPFVSMIGTLAIGVALGAGVRGRAATADRVVFVGGAPSAAPQASPTNTPPAPVPEPEAPVAAPAPRPSGQARASTSATDPLLDSRALSTERALLDVARAALSRGEAAQAVEVARRHAEEFPNGQLVEEREAILIRALVQTGAADEARAHASRFRSRFPKSIFGRTIDAALGSLP